MKTIKGNDKKEVTKELSVPENFEKADMDVLRVNVFQPLLDGLTTLAERGTCVAMGSDVPVTKELKTLPFEINISDQSDMHDVSARTSSKRFKLKSPGVYLIVAQVKTLNKETPDIVIKHESEEIGYANSSTCVAVALSDGKKTVIEIDSSCVLPTLANVRCSIVKLS